jgi:hypothetical protein
MYGTLPFKPTVFLYVFFLKITKRFYGQKARASIYCIVALMCACVEDQAKKNDF